MACSRCRAILMLAGIYYGAQYGGAICSILLNLPCHPPHAVTCLDGYPMTQAGQRRHGARHHHDGALFGAAFGIMQMIFLAPLLVADRVLVRRRPKSAR